MITACDENGFSVLLMNCSCDFSHIKRSVFGIQMFRGKRRKDPLLLDCFLLNLRVSVFLPTEFRDSVGSDANIPLWRLLKKITDIRKSLTLRPSVFKLSAV